MDCGFCKHEVRPNQRTAERDGVTVHVVCASDIDVAREQGETVVLAVDVPVREEYL
jgi:hypothetical protein